MAVTTEQIQKYLPSLLEARLGVSCGLTGCRRLTAGASADTWWLEAECAGPQQWILRLDAGAEDLGMAPGKHWEARAQQAASRAGCPVASVITILDGSEGLGEGYLMEALSGESLPPALLRESRYALARERFCADAAVALAAIHRTPLDDLQQLPMLDATAQLSQLYAMHKDYGESLPVFSLAYGWLKDHAPQTATPALVHGDFRLGNFLLTEQGLNGVLDWELTHLGDPMEDLGWLCVNAWRFGRRDKPVGGMASREALYAAYERASGQQVDETRVRYWELLGTFKWGVICQYQAYSFLRGHVPSLERAAIGRRVAETEYDMLVCLQELMELNHAD
ncbi:phosphotransferase family protein [Alcanivorax sp. DP30]|uniref:phosphotransferase family protein n=1 Tax=Alcanivorax sp. DP30 TaxID=2606217 RepID=UPI001371BDFE|nr:phosphotransferase family protein [Alcanivorax sp. DP30]MZR63306.1 phosphotransferase [Alcanivorax sp. DP30]